MENLSKRFKPFPAIMLMLSWEKHKQGIMMLMTRLSSTLQFHFFCFGFNESL